MIPDLEIRVLFCYSPEVLANTYNDLDQLKEDNTELCNVAQDVFKKNVKNYNVKVSVANHVEVKKLQYQYGTYYKSLTRDQVNDLSECTLEETTQLYPSMFGLLPDYLLKLKRDNNATVLILQVFAYDSSNQGDLNYDYSSCIGVEESRENTVALGRTIGLKGIKNSFESPLTLAHEFGHLMGCYHPYGVGAGFDDDLGDNHGHCIIDHNNIIVQGTIMSYAKNPIFYYSNPNLFEYPAPYQNEPCGVVGISEAYKTVNANIQKLAGIF